MSELLRLINVTKKVQDVTLFEKINITFEERGLYGLKGDSGSGKSSFLYILGLLDEDYEGEIRYFEKNISHIKNKEELINKHIGFVFQNPVFIQDLTIKDNLSLVLNESNKVNVSLLLDRVGLSNYENKKVSQLSGGERMRLSLVRALANDPEILLCDEPTASLNIETANVIMKLLKEESQKRLVIIVSHDFILLNQYADIIYELKNKSITLIKKTKIKSLKGEKKNKKTSTISLAFIFKYIESKYKSKRIQTMICLFALLLSFFTIGFSTLLRDEISSQIKESFKSLMEEDQVLFHGSDIEKKNEIITISSNEAQDIIDESEYFYEYNYLYQGDFESQFKDANYLALESDDPLIFFDINLRTVAESILISDIPYSYKIYPSRVENLTMDEGVLGLRRSDIKRICNALDLENNITSLSNYLTYHHIDFCFYFQNESWNYYNEIIFRMRAFFVVEERVIIAHTQKNYIQDFFETRMKLPISLDLKRSEYLPWTIKRATYIRTNWEYAALIEYFKSEYYAQYDLSRVKGDLRSSFLSSPFHQGKYIVTYATKGKVPFSIVEEMKDSQDIDSFFPTGNYYPVLKEAMVSGFNNAVFLSPHEDKLFDIENYYSSIKENIDSFDLTKINYPANITYGNLISAALQKGVKLETQVPSLTLGRYPENENEIVISSALAKKLFDNKNVLNERVYFLFHEYDLNLFNQFKKSSLIISGIYEDKLEKIYQEAYWYPSYITVNFDYPLDSIYINSFVCKTSKNIDDLNGKYLDIKFENPLKEIYLSVDSVIEMIQIILNVFYVLIFIIAFGILQNTLQNIMKEASKEIGMLKCIGMRKIDVFKQYIIYGISYSLIALVLATICLFMSYVLVRCFYFKQVISLNISLTPYYVMILNAIILTLPISIIQIIRPLRRDSLSLLKRYY